MAKTLRCDICQKPISIYFPLHDCKPNLSNLIRLLPNYTTAPPDAQARWIESLLYGLNRGHKPNWYDEHCSAVEGLIERHGEHLMYDEEKQ